jgi:xylulose-5-phosphate/fructose-6-phosphate phosphoketolase
MKKEGTVKEEAPSAEDLGAIDAYWRAANYLSVGQIYLYDNPLLKEPLRKDHVKPRLLGHWGTTPGLNFIYVHLNRVIRAHDLSVLYTPGSRAPTARSTRTSRRTRRG